MSIRRESEESMLNEAVLLHPGWIPKTDFHDLEQLRQAHLAHLRLQPESDDGPRGRYERVQNAYRPAHRGWARRGDFNVPAPARPERLAPTEEELAIARTESEA